MGRLGLCDMDGLSLGIDDGVLSTFLSSLLVKLTLFRFLVIVIPSIFLCRVDWLFCWHRVGVDRFDVVCTGL